MDRSEQSDRKRTAAIASCIALAALAILLVLIFGGGGEGPDGAGDGAASRAARGAEHEDAVLGRAAGRSEQGLGDGGTAPAREASESVIVRYIDDLGEPVAGVEVRAVGGASGARTSGADGTVAWVRQTEDDILVHCERLPKGYGQLGGQLSPRFRAGRDESEIVTIQLRKASVLTVEIDEICWRSDADSPVLALHMTRAASEPYITGFQNRFEQVVAGTRSVRMDVCAGRHELHLKGFGPNSDFLGCQTFVAVLPGKDLTCRMIPRPMSGVVRARVLDSSGEPVAGVYVSYLHFVNRTGWWKMALTDEEGRVVLKGLAPGVARVNVDPRQIHHRPSALHAYYGSFKSPWATVHGNGTELILKLARGFSIRGSVWRGGKRLEKGTVMIDHARSEITAKTEIQKSGQEPAAFAFHNLRASTYRLWPEDMEKASVLVTVGEATGDAEVRIEFD